VSALITDASGGVLTLRITGKLKQPELAEAQKAAGEFIRAQGKVRLLVVAENFEGMERGGNWGDVSFQAEHDRNIEKIAIVGEKRWEDLALVFAGKGVRRVPIEYFQPADLAKAQTWLTASAQ
jgi:hypothetical protein